MARVAFLGLGQMGTPMAARLLHSGHHVTVWDRTADKATPLVQQGATAARSPAEAAAGAELAITMLATLAAVDDVLFGRDGAALTLRGILVEMSTIGPRAFLSIAGRLPGHIAAVDAPVRGSVLEATAGKLEVFVGASDPEFERVRPILELLGTVRHVGPPGGGAAMKLVVNLALGAAIVALGEALALARGLGIDRKEVLDVLEESPIGPAVRAKRANLEAMRFPPSFKLRHAAKDLRLVDEAAEALGLSLPAARAAREWLDEAVDRGAGDVDYSAVVATILGREPAPGGDSPSPSWDAPPPVPH
jgi:3-hydroxyisobutyrate dehydrogenase-like beta-hydroxyacid dehydrogenase